MQGHISVSYSRTKTQQGISTHVRNVRSTFRTSATQGEQMNELLHLVPSLIIAEQQKSQMFYDIDSYDSNKTYDI